MDMNDAGRIIAVVDRRIEKKTGVEATVETTWGEVCGLSADGKYASAYLYGETEIASEDFRVPSDLALNIGDKVKVAWNGRGERWVYDVMVASEYKKLALNPTTGEILTGDGTAPPAVVGDIHAHGPTVDLEAEDITATTVSASGAVTAGSLTFPSGDVIEPDPSTEGIQLYGPAGDETRLVLTGDTAGPARRLFFKALDTDTQEIMRIGYASTNDAEIAMGVGGSTLTDVRMYRMDANVMAMADGDLLDQEVAGLGLYRSTSWTHTTAATYEKVTGWTQTSYISGNFAHEESDCIVIDRAGVYLVMFGFRFVNAPTGGRVGGGLRIGAGVDPGSGGMSTKHFDLRSTAQTANHYNQTGVVESFAVNDFISLQVWQNVAAGQPVDALHLTAIRLGRLA